MKLRARVEGIGLVGPGLASWHAARDVLAGRAPYVPCATLLPAPEALPPTERRRAGKSVRLALAAGFDAAKDAGRAARDYAAIFASSSGDGENCHSICEVLASDERLISPTRFHNSVHNAPAGYWGIATGAMRPADCVAAFDGSFGAGLLEALARLAVDPAQPALAVAYDAPYPEPLGTARPIMDSFALGLALASAAEGDHGPRISVEPSRDAPEVFGDAALERLRRGIPTARALPLLALIARGVPGHTVIEYLDGLALRVEFTP